MKPPLWKLGQELYYAAGSKTYARALETKYEVCKIVITNVKIHNVEYNVPVGGIKNQPVLRGDYIYECIKSGITPPFSLPTIVYTTRKSCREAIRDLYNRDIKVKNEDIETINELVAQI